MTTHILRPWHPPSTQFYPPKRIPTHQSFTRTQFCPKPTFPLSPCSPNKTTTPPRPTCRRSSGNDPREKAFFDEDGVVQDMDGYLNYLSLEYDSVWDTKPSWCQPWTITLTGVFIVTSSWLLLHSPIVTAVLLTLICTWWYIFLYSYPKAYADMIAERRKKVTSGLEDTYGSRKNQ